MAVVPRAAATVALLRDGRDGLEAYLQLRPARMGFAGGLWVFPGGRVDEADADPAVDATWAGPSPAAWAGRLGMAVGEARGHVVAACRETLEEAGLLLATPPPGVAEVAAVARVPISELVDPVEQRRGGRVHRACEHPQPLAALEPPADDVPISVTHGSCWARVTT